MSSKDMTICKGEREREKPEQQVLQAVRSHDCNNVFSEALWQGTHMYMARDCAARQDSHLHTR